jgi:glycosyltransferase involved in cell wall biosynthesis
MDSVSLVMPCLNEEKTVGLCVKRALSSFGSAGITGEVIVVDNNSDDLSKENALREGARVIRENEPGYGAACIKGLKNAKGNIVVFSDSDGTYDLSEIMRIVKEIQKGNDLCVGSRFLGKMGRNSMPWLHRKIGNPFLTKIFNALFGTNFTDTHSGFRAGKKKVLLEMGFGERGFNLTLEMLVKSKKMGFGVCEVPVSYFERIGSASKLSSFRHGFGHLVFMLRACFF